MGDRICAIHVPILGPVPRTVALLREAEELGVEAAWLTSGGYGPEPLTTLAAVAAGTSRMLLGSSVVVTYFRHPLITAQQSLALDDLAPGRFRLGLGSGHRSTVDDAFGLDFDAPLEHLREYVAVVRAAMAGAVDHSGVHFRVRATLARPHRVPIYVGALRYAGYRQAGEIADGAISWATPPAFLRDVARPALVEGALSAGRATPRLVGAVLALVTDDRAATREVARERVAANTRQVFYRRLFADAGFPEATDGNVPDALLDELVVVGDEGEVTSGLARYFDAGCDELIVSLLPGSDDDVGRTLRLVGRARARSEGA